MFNNLLFSLKKILKKKMKSLIKNTFINNENYLRRFRLNDSKIVYFFIFFFFKFYRIRLLRIWK